MKKPSIYKDQKETELEMTDSNKHLSEYTRNELLKCLYEAGLGVELRDNTTENLREILNQMIQDGDAPTLDEIGE